MRYTLITLVAVMSLGISLIKAPMTFDDMTVEQRAEECGMTVEEFILISSCVEAESDRSESLDGRILIAETILNRVEDDRFPDTITEVLTQRGQFSTIRSNGTCVVSRTNISDRAVYEAVQEIELGEAPNVLFFNCIGYNYGTPYDYVDGNYFMEA